MFKMKELKNSLITNTPKVLVVDLSENYGGASARALTLMQNYPAGKIYLATLKDSPVLHYALALNLRVIVVGRKKYDISILFNLIKAIRTYEFDLLDAQNIQSKFWGSISASFSRVSLVSTLNSWYFNEHQKTNIKGVLYTLIELLTDCLTSYYIVVSQNIFDALRKARVEPDRISLIYNAIDCNITNSVTNNHNLRKKLNIPMKSIICVALGRLVWAKGYEILIQAFELLKDEEKNVFCLIIGSGELHSALSEQIIRGDLSNRVFLLGHLDHEKALSILKTSDMFVMPSRTEGTPIALLEAAALGIPILATNVGGIPELVTDNDALLVSANSPKALANGIIKLANDRKFAQTISDSAQKRIADYFSIEKLLNATLQVYRKVAC